MTWIKRWLLIMAALLLPAVPGHGAHPAHRFIAGLEAYHAGRYAQAIESWESIALAGVANGRLYYNLGNACLKAGRLGPAILWYERARELLPNDPDLRFNLAYARSLTQDAPAQNTASLARIFFFWKYHLGRSTVILAALAGNLIFWLLVAGWRLTGRRGLHRASVMVAVPTLIFVLTAAVNYYQAAHPDRAVVLPAQVSVRSGLSDKDTELFVLHAGATVRVVRRQKSHVQIRFSEDKIGWLEGDAIELIDGAARRKPG